MLTAEEGAVVDVLIGASEGEAILRRLRLQQVLKNLERSEPMSERSIYQMSSICRELHRTRRLKQYATPRCELI